MKNKLLLFIAMGIVLTTQNLFAQAPSIQWQKCLGGTNSEQSFNSIEQTTDGGYILASWTDSYDGDVSGNHGVWNIWIVKLNNLGAIQWKKCFGGSGDTSFMNWNISIKQTLDGGYVFASTTMSNDFDVSGNHGGYDIWVVKLNSTGNIQWQKCLGGTGMEFAQSIELTSDGGYILASWTDSNDGDVSGNHSGTDAWIIKLNSTGVIQWQKCIGGSGLEQAYSIKQTPDNGYVVACRAYSNNGDVSGNHGGGDFWLVKLNSSGVIQWQKCYGGTNYEEASDIQLTNDGGYIICGQTNSNNGDVIGFHGGVDCFVIKVNSLGAIQWQKCLGGTTNNGPFAGMRYRIIQTNNGGFIVFSTSDSNDGDVIGNAFDYWIVKLNSSGTIQWQKCLGGTSMEQACSVNQTSDGGFILSGYTLSNDVDVSGNHGGSGSVDAWIVKLSAETLNSLAFDSDTISISPNPASTQVNISFNNITDLTGGNINIINSLGQQVATTPITLSGTSTTMALDTWGGSGLYFVQILNAQGQILDIKKIILQ
jgi:hypothetical protein